MDRDVEAIQEALLSLGESRRTLRRAVARLNWQTEQLERAAAIRERAARRVLPEDEEAARAYLAQRHLLLERCDRLKGRVETLRNELDELERLYVGALAVRASARRGAAPVP